MLLLQPSMVPRVQMVVVLITTKRGKTGEAKFTYDGMLAIAYQGKRIDISESSVNSQNIIMTL